MSGLRATEIPKFDERVVPTVEALKRLGGSASNEELHDWVADHLALAKELKLGVSVRRVEQFEIDEAFFKGI